MTQQIDNMLLSDESTKDQSDLESKLMIGHAKGVL